MAVETRKDTQRERESEQPPETTSGDNNSAGNPETTASGEQIKKKLKEHFSDPYTRVCREQRTRKKCPEKLTILIVKFFFVTAQLCMFGSDRADFANYLERNNIAMKHLLLKGWQPEYETMPYPPTSGTYALYRIEELFEHIDHAITGLDDVPNVALGSFFVNDEGFPNKPVQLCVEYFNKGRYNKSGAIEIDSTINTDCTQVGIDNVNSSYGLDPSLKDLIRSTDGQLVRLLQVRLSFSIDSVYVHMEKTVRELQCFRIFGEINFNNYGINGQIPVTMKTRIEEKACQGKNSESAETYEWVIAMVVCLLSILSATFSSFKLISSCILAQKTSAYFKEKKNKDLSCEGKFEIITERDIIVIISDVLSFCGSVMKIVLNNKNLSSSSFNYDVCGILIGVGCLLVWLTLLHYLAYDPDFNLLFSVIHRSAGKVFRFLLCVGMLYLAFTLCGWVVLGPYHIKFTDISSSFQSLMSLLNGDEVYVTYTAVEGDKSIVWWFNTIFVTVFVVVFTLITLNILIAIFNSAYETIKNKEDKIDLAEFLEKDNLNEIDYKTCKERCCC